MGPGGMGGSKGPSIPLLLALLAATPLRKTSMKLG